MKGIKHDAGKPRFTLIPASVELEIAKVLTFGSAKYSDDNWSKVSNGKQRYLDAALRHINAYRNGNDLDGESGLHHIAHAITNLMFVLYYVINNKE